MNERTDCGKLLKQIHDEMRKNINNAMRAQNMTMAQWDALLELDLVPEKQLSFKDLEQRLRIAQSTTVGIISRLEQKGLVEGLGDPNDRRVKLARITPAGMARIAEAELGRAEAEARLLAGLTETERDIFLALLKKVRDTLR